LHQWHWISAAVSLLAMLVFALTGITLNHAASIEAKPVVTARRATLPDALRAQLQQDPPALPGAASGKRAQQLSAPLPGPVVQWIAQSLHVDVNTRPGDWSDGEVYVALARPGGDAFLTVDRKDGEVLYERTDRGWIAYLNDLHKGRNTGDAWSLFIDIFAIACFVFCLTGLVLLQLHSRHRPMTWPTVALGLAIPLVLAIVFIH
jgi:hypothetical protein